MRYERLFENDVLFDYCSEYSCITCNAIHIKIPPQSPQTKRLFLTYRWGSNLCCSLLYIYINIKVIYSQEFEIVKCHRLGTIILDIQE